MKNRSWRLAVVFSVSIFIIFTLTMFISGFIAMLMFRFGIFHTQRPEYMLLSFMIGSLIIGTALSQGVGKKMLSPIKEISEATKEVAKGNFDITLEANSMANEINEMARNFLLMAQELSAIETFRNDFINNVSHEFKTPLSAIEGYATLLQSKSLSEEKREAYVAKILYSSRRLSSLTGNILQLSRLENQEITAEKQWFSLDEQVRQIILMFEDDWNRKNLELDIDLETIDYYGNSDLLAQVWQNLIANAMKFVPDKGRIRVLLRKEQENIKAFVSDTGAGMSADVKQRVFEKFYQGDTSHSAEGNGLGLTLANRIVVLHNGIIEVSSKEGKGTTFIVTLPVYHEIQK